MVKITCRQTDGKQKETDSQLYADLHPFRPRNNNYTELAALIWERQVYCDLQCQIAEITELVKGNQL